MRIAVAASVFLAIPLALELAARVLWADPERLLVSRGKGDAAAIVPNPGHALIETDSFAHFRQQKIARPTARAVPIRILGVGESTLAGYGFGPNWSDCGSFLRVAETLLRYRHPDEARGLEVHNLAIPGYGTHVMAQIIEELADMGITHAVYVVQAGHNEGLNHVLAETVARESTVYRFSRWLRRHSRFYSAAVAALRAIGRSGRPEKVPALPLLNRELRSLILRDLARNLNAIAQAARRSHSKVILCTAAANERDWPPTFFSFGDRFRPEDKEEFLRIRNEACLHYARCEMDEAIEKFRACLRLTGGEATTSFWLAHALEESGKPSEAAECYRDARNLDGTTGLARASDAVNGLLRSWAAEHGWGLVDMDAIARARAGDRPPGKEEMLDNVHPNYGTSVAFGIGLAEELRKALDWPAREDVPVPQDPDFYASRRPVDQPGAASNAVHYYIDVCHPEAARYYSQQMNDWGGTLIQEMQDALFDFQSGDFVRALDRFEAILANHPAHERNQCLDSARMMKEVLIRLPAYKSREECPGLHPLPDGMLIARKRYVSGLSRPFGFRKARLTMKAPDDFEMCIDGVRLGRGFWEGDVTWGYHAIVGTNGREYAFRLLRVSQDTLTIQVVPRAALPEGANVRLESPDVVSSDGSRMGIFRCGPDFLVVDRHPVTREQFLEAFPDTECGERGRYALVRYGQATDYLRGMGKRLLTETEWLRIQLSWSKEPGDPSAIEMPGDPFVKIVRFLQTYLLEAEEGDWVNRSERTRQQIIRELVPGDLWDEYVIGERGGERRPWYLHYRAGALSLGAPVDYNPATAEYSARSKAGFRGVFGLQRIRSE